MLSSLTAFFTGNNTSSSRSRRGTGTSLHSVVVSNDGSSPSYPPQHSPNAANTVKHSLARIRQLLRRVNPELLDTLSYPATQSTIADLQRALREYAIPADILQLYAAHDGQDTFSVPRSGENEEVEGNKGFIYGLWWMSIEEVIQEYHFWRRLDISTPPSPVNMKRQATSSSANAKGKGKERRTHTARAPSTDAFLFGSEMDPQTVRGGMRSCPEGYVREEYSHPSWLPILKDGYGNYIGIDLDPPSLHPDDEAAPLPNGQQRILPGRGQVIAFGREIDTKTILWNGWADPTLTHGANSSANGPPGSGGFARFLASFADDLSASAPAAASSRYSSRDARSSMNTSYSTAEGDSDYYYSSEGRHTAPLPSSESSYSTGLEWMRTDSSYAGMGTIEALVERSKRFWGSVGMYTGDEEPQEQRVASASPSGSRERSTRPTPLKIPSADPGNHALIGKVPSEPGAAGDDSLANATTEISLDDEPDSPSHSPKELSSGGLTHPSTLAAEHPRALSPLSPEPSLILSPPSPKENERSFSPFRPPSPTPPQNPSSGPEAGTFPVGGLHSPARMSPNQQARYDARQRAASPGGRRQSLANGSSNVRERKPPPPIMSLGLPTLEFGNGIWEYHDTDVSTDPLGLEKNSFEVIIDRR